MSITIEQAKVVIDELKKEKFNSQEFIGKYIEKCEKDYIDMLIKSRDSGCAFQMVNSHIAQFLSAHHSELGIIKNGKVDGTNVHKNESPSEEWILVRK
jgi:hypothetical protein